MLPWADDVETLEAIAAMEGAMKASAVLTNESFNHNSYYVPSVFVFVILGLFMTLVLLSGLARFFSLAHKQLTGRNSQWMPAAIRKHLVDAPLFGHQHAQPLKIIPGVGRHAKGDNPSHFVTLALPLRGQTIIIIVYAFLNILPMVALYTPTPPELNFYYADTYHTTFIQIVRYLADRTGVLAVGQLPLIFLLAGRQSPVRTITGAGFDVLMLYHRWVARMVTLQALVHSIAWTAEEYYSGGRKGFLEALSYAYWAWGTAATAFMCAMVVFSMRYLREACYEAFVLIHILLGIVTVVAIFYHILLMESPRFAMFMDLTWASIAFWAFDRFVRFARLVLTNVNLFGGPGSLITKGRISIAADSNGDLMLIRVWPSGPMRKLAVFSSPGADVLLHVPRLQPLASHPFSVMAGGEDENGRPFIDLLVRPREGVTARMRKRALKGDFEAYMLIEGPCSEQTELNPDEGSVMITGGVGIAHTLPNFVRAIREDASIAAAATKSEAGEDVKGRNVELIWLARAPATFYVALPYLEAAVAQLRSAQSGPSRTQFHVRLCWTDAGDSAPLASTHNSEPSAESKSTEVTEEKKIETPETPNSLDDNASLELPTLAIAKIAGIDPEAKRRFDALAPEVQVSWSNGRPDLAAMTRAAQAECSRPHIAVLACGPPGLLDVACAASRSLDDVHYEEAPFAW